MQPPRVAHAGQPGAQAQPGARSRTPPCTVLPSHPTPFSAPTPTLSPARRCIGLPAAMKHRTPSHGDQDAGQPRCTRWGRAPRVSLPTAPRGCLVCQMLKEPVGSPGTASTGRCGEVSRVSQPVMTRGGARAQLEHGWD